MEITTTDKYCIITPLTPKLSQREVVRLVEEMDNNQGLNIGIDLSYVNDCTIDFIDCVKKYTHIGLFNISSDIFAILTLMGLDKRVNLFVSDNDFKSNKHRLLNRHFKLV